MKHKIGLLLLCALLTGCGNKAPVDDTDPNVNITRTTFLLNYSFVEMDIGQSLELCPLTYEPVSPLTWVSSDPLVATVNDGVVTPINYGTVTISAFDSMSIGTCSITVKEQEVAVDFKIEPTNIVLNVGESNSVKPILIKNGIESGTNGVEVTLKEESTSGVASYTRDGEYYVFTALKSGTAIYSFVISIDDSYFGANLSVKVN